MTDFNAFISAATSGHIDAGVTPLPERIGRYRVESLLGQGGFGMEFLAYDEQLKRSVHTGNIEQSGSQRKCDGSTWRGP